MTCWICKRPYETIGPVYWCHPCGMGESAQLATNQDYDHAYALKYLQYASTPLGKALEEFRAVTILGILKRGETFLDFGCGLGGLVARLRQDGLAAAGYEPMAGFQKVHPLVGTSSLIVNTLDKVFELDGVGFFDSLEHIERPDKIFRLLRPKWLVVSIPIINFNPKDLFNWRHYRPTEHMLYFTHDGFRRFLEVFGFEISSMNEEESNLGREDIVTYIAQRRH